MLTGLEILIARMKDHPDEFIKHYKWDGLIEDFRENFTLDEWEAYKAARSEMMRDLFNEAVLKRLAGEEDDGKTLPSTATYSTAQVKKAPWSDPRAMFGQSIMNDATLTAKQVNAAMQQQAYYTATNDAARQAVQRNAAMQQQGLLQGQLQAYNPIDFNPFV